VVDKNRLDMGQKVTFWYFSSLFGQDKIFMFLPLIYFGPNEEQGIKSIDNFE
jgi:hypothetical protein